VIRLCVVGTDAAFPLWNDAVTTSVLQASIVLQAAVLQAASPDEPSAAEAAPVTHGTIQNGTVQNGTRQNGIREQDRGLLGHVLDHLAVADARAAGAAAATVTGPGYNPLVIVGPAAAGKSRLAGDLFIAFCRLQRGAPGPGDAPTAPTSPCLWDGRSLARDLTAALSSDTLHRLHARFENAGLVVIDGVEQITAWDAQRWLALLFDVAAAAGTAVVATLRLHPTACPGLEPSLASRLSGGLVVSLPPPAAKPAGDLGVGGAAAPSLRRIIGVAARRHGLAVADLTGPSRRRSVTEARGEAMYVARALTGKSLQALGSAFGGRDHTTVLHGIRVTERRRVRNPVLAAEIDRAIESLRRPSRRRGLRTLSRRAAGQPPVASPG